MDYKGIKVLYDDNHIIVVNKPNGMLSQKDVTGDDSIIEVLKEYLKKKYNKPGNVFLGSVHRLDRPTSGVMVFAKTSKALTRLTIALKNKQFQKRYYAIVEGRVMEYEGKLEHYLLKNSKKNTVSAYNFPKDRAKKAVLEFKTLNIYGEYSLLDIKIITGRPHQIRVQLKEALFPISGDLKYGAKFKKGEMNLCLHCHSLSFEHPVKKEKMVFNSLPDFDKCVWNYFIKYLS